MKKYKLGIALSGGGARGIAHLGVLDALHKHGVEPEVVSGTSIGAIIGCFYCAGFEPKMILRELKKERITKFISFSLPGDGIFDLEHIEELMSKFIGHNDFNALKKPFYVSVSNLNSGKNEIISEGKLFDYVIASASIPIIFKTRTINNQLYADGGLQNNLPVNAIKDVCKKVIGVHINHTGPLKNISGVKEIAERCIRLVVESNIKDSIKASDIFIQPNGVKDFNTFDFRKADQIYEVGFNATEEMMPQIYKELGIKSRPAIKVPETDDHENKPTKTDSLINKAVRSIKESFRSSDPEIPD